MMQGVSHFLAKDVGVQYQRCAKNITLDCG